jgi:hypothetical protein
MRVRVAYISSLGTTAILVAAALTLLTVVGTIVAFKGWPGNVQSSAVQSVPLAPSSPVAPSALVRRTPQQVFRKPQAHAAARHASTVGLVKTPGTGKQFVPGLIMVPVHAAPPRTPHPVGPAQTPRYPEPVSAQWAPRGVPSADQGPGTVPTAGEGLSIPSVDQSVASSAPDQVSAIVTSVLSGAPPLPLH